MGYTVGFTGHRSSPEEARASLANELDRVIAELYSLGADTFISGGALGFDLIAACRTARFRAENDGVRLVLALPCRDQTARWTDYDSLRAYKMLFSHADEVHYSDAFYTSDCMLKRNRYMVGRADACVAYCLRNSGGTAYTVRRAEEKHIPVINLARGGWDKSEFEGFCKK